MRMEEVTTGTPITLLVTINGKQLSFNSQIQEVYPKRHLVLAEPVFLDEKIISFRGKNILVDIVVSFPDEKPQIFKNVTVITMKRADNSLCYSLSTFAESKTFNRRESYRCYVGIPTAVQCGPNHPAHNAVIRDVSLTGFSVTCNQDTELSPDKIIHVLLNDYIEELAENFSFHLYGMIVRSQELENGKTVYGCRLNNHVGGLENYIMKKERIRLQNTNGGKL